MKQRSLLLVLAFLPFAATRLFAGCAAQQEGQLCSILNNTNDDCAAGLTCQSIPGKGYYACCPPTGSTNPACMGSNVLSDGGTGGSGGGGTGASTSSSSSTSTSTSSSSTSTSTSSTSTSTSSTSTSASSSSSSASSSSSTSSSSSSSGDAGPQDASTGG